MSLTVLGIDIAKQKFDVALLADGKILDPNGNPRMDSIVGFLKVLQTKENIKLRTNML